MTLSQTEARELAAIMNRARSLDLRDGLFLDCRTPEDCARALVLLAKQGRDPERLGLYKLVCRPKASS